MELATHSILELDAFFLGDKVEPVFGRDVVEGAKAELAASRGERLDDSVDMSALLLSAVCIASIHLVT